MTPVRRRRPPQGSWTGGWATSKAERPSKSLPLGHGKRLGARFVSQRVTRWQCGQMGTSPNLRWIHLGYLWAPLPPPGAASRAVFISLAESSNAEIITYSMNLGIHCLSQWDRSRWLVARLL